MLWKFASYLDYLYNWLFPHAIVYGMNSDDFWYGEPQLFFSYAKAYEMRMEQQAEYDNIIAWRQGLYNVYAIGQCPVGGNKVKYPKKPFEITKKDEMPLNMRVEMRKERMRKMTRDFAKRKGE